MLQKQMGFLLKRGYSQLDISKVKNLDQFIEAFEQAKKDNGPHKRFFGVFDNCIFLSNDPDVNVDYIYVAVTGLTKQQYILDRQKFINDYVQRYEDYKKNISKHIYDWIERGHKIIYKHYWTNWDKIVPMRANSDYMGEELNIALDILNNIHNGDVYDTVLNKFMATKPDKNKFLAIKKILWLIGGESFVDFLNNHVQITNEEEKTDNESN